MRTALGTSAVIATIIAMHAIPGFVMEITPAWLIEASIIAIFGVLPVTAFIVFVTIVGKKIKEGKI